jgi:hypothetical protein
VAYGNTQGKKEKTVAYSNTQGKKDKTVAYGNTQGKKDKTVDATVLSFCLVLFSLCALQYATVLFFFYLV